MNILVANLSKLPFPPKDEKEVKEFTYNVHVDGCDKDVITAKYTNECILECVENLGKIKSEGLDKVIILVSTVVQNTANQYFGNKTAYMYYTNLVGNYNNKKTKIVAVMIEEDGGKDADGKTIVTERNTAEILQEICSHINKEDNVYIDSAGGKRTIANTIQLLTKMLTYIGVSNPLTLYADIQNNPHSIVDNSEFVRMTDLTDGFHEFMTTGKADQLQKCVGTDMDSETSRLIDKICEFSDKIRIGDIDRLDDTILHLKELIEACRSNPISNSIESVILQQFIPVFDEKLLGEQHDKVNYPKIITWCLDNMLIQQAFTLFVEKIPVYVLENGLLDYTGNPKSLVAAKMFYDMLDDCKIKDSDLKSKPTKSGNTMRFWQIKYIREHGLTNDKYKLKVPLSQLEKMLYAYVYVKSIRNQINHASSEEKFTQEQKDFLSGLGFDFSDNTLKTLSHNLSNALKYYEKDIKVSPSVQQNTEENYTPTTLSKGDEKSASIVGTKRVRIEGYDYDIQLVMPKYDKRHFSVGTNLKVKIKQISKSGKITQVELV